MDDLNKDFTKYKRVFAFGCSFTHWHYPTWANVMHQSIPNATLINLGQGGAGNTFIANRVTQANRTYNFCNTDLVIIMWSTFGREDRYVDKKWITPGNIFNQGEYDNNFVKKYSDPIGYLIRDLSNIDLVTSYLDSLPCDWLDILSVPFDYQILDKDDIVYKDIMYTYRELISRFDKPTMIEAMNGIFKGGLSYEYHWDNNKLTEDYHPNTLQYSEFLQRIGFPLTSESITYAEEAYRKAKAVKNSTEFPPLFPEMHTNTYQFNWQMVSGD